MAKNTYFCPCVRSFPRSTDAVCTGIRLENYGDYTSSIQVWTRRKDTFRLEGDITYRIEPFDGPHGGAALRRPAGRAAH